MENKFSYSSEDEKCYGATGMAMAVVIFDGDDYLASVDLDAEPMSVVNFTTDFYINTNPSLSAKSVWNHLLKNFNLTMALSIANVMCRKIVLNGEAMDTESTDLLRSLMVEEGRESCELDEDETSRLFNKNYMYLHRVFNHMGVQSVAHDFAKVLKRRRSLSRLEVLEQLRALSML